jgi:hypothetical protein
VTGPIDALPRAAPSPAGDAADPALPAALARLDQASAGPHPLPPALLHRARLDAVRRQAAADGHLLVDPWHLAALVEGLRPRRLRGARSSAAREASPRRGASSRRGAPRSPTTGG